MTQYIEPSRRTFLSAITLGVLASPARAAANLDAAGQQIGAGPPSAGGSAAGLAGPAGSSLIGHLGSGTAAIARPLQAILREHVSAKDNGATGDGAVDDHNALATVLADHPGREIRFPTGTYLTRAPLVPRACSAIVGEGPSSTVRSDAAAGPLFAVRSSDVSIARVRIEGAAGSDVLENGAVKILSAHRTRIADAEASGMAGSAFCVTAGSSHAQLWRLFVHDLSGRLPNASDVMLYGGTSRNTVAFSTLSGGRAVGVYSQLDSTRHKIAFNYVDGQTIYGIMDYDTLPRDTYTLIIGNSVENISGREDIDGARRGGSGIYTADTGGQIISNNHVGNTNLDTAVETLVPAGVAVNATNSTTPALVAGNYVHHNNWYGIMLAFNRQPSPLIGNIVHENARDQVYFKDADHAFALGNAISATRGSAGQARCINVNVSSAGKRGALVLGNRTRGGRSVGIDARHTSQSLFVGNNISDCAGRGLQLLDAAGQVVSGNLIDVSDGNEVAVNLIDVTYSSVANLVLKIGAGARAAVAIAGTCTGTRIDRSVVIVGKADPMNFIDNASVGCIVEQWGSAPPSLLAHAVGDTVWNSAPAGGRPVGWVCTVAGTPGTWVAMAAL